MGIRARTSSPSSAGEFVWTGFDYLGEPTPYNSDRSNLLNFTDPADRARAQKELRRSAGSARRRAVPISASSISPGFRRIGSTFTRRAGGRTCRWRTFCRTGTGPIASARSRRSTFTPRATKRSCSSMANRSGERKRSIRISPALGRRGLSARRTQSGRLQAKAGNGRPT